MSVRELPGLVLHYGDLDGGFEDRWKGENYSHCRTRELIDFGSDDELSLKP